MGHGQGWGYQGGVSDRGGVNSHEGPESTEATKEPAGEWRKAGARILFNLGNWTQWPFSDHSSTFPLLFSLPRPLRHAVPLDSLCDVICPSLCLEVAEHFLLFKLDASWAGHVTPRRGELQENQQPALRLAMTERGRDLQISGGVLIGSWSVGRVGLWRPISMPGEDEPGNGAKRPEIWVFMSHCPVLKY